MRFTRYIVEIYYFTTASLYYSNFKQNDRLVISLEPEDCCTICWKGIGKGEWLIITFCLGRAISHLVIASFIETMSFGLKAE